MRRVIDYTSKYEAKDGEHVIRANARFFDVEDLKSFDAVCIEDEALVDGVEIEVISTKKKRASKKEK